MCGIAVPAGQKDSQHKHTHGIGLTVLGTVHKRHGGGAANLRPPEKAGFFPAVHAAAEKSGQLSGRPAEGKAKEGRQGETVQHLDPFQRRWMPPRPPCSAMAAPTGRRSWRGFAGGNAEIPSRHGPQHNGEQCGAQGDRGLCGIATEVHHVVDGLRTEALISVMTSTPRKLQPAAIKMAARGAHGTGGNAGGNGIGASVHPLTKMTPR